MKVLKRLCASLLCLSFGLAGLVTVGHKASSVKAASGPIMTFDFEDNSAHRTSGSNSYGSSGNTYSENGADISLVYADSVTSGIPLGGSANILGRIAKNTTNSPSVILGPIDLSNYNVSSFSYEAKTPAAFTLTAQYSEDGSTWVNGETHTNKSAQSTFTSSDFSVENCSTFYIKIVMSVESSTGSNRDGQIDNIVINGESTGSAALESISCSDQSVSVLGTVDLSSQLTFGPSDAANKTVSYTLTSGSDYVDLNGSVVTGKKGGSAVITITPEDTSGGATAISVNISITSISVPPISVGDQYVIYAIDEKDSCNGELTGVASSIGTVNTFSGSVPSCSHVFDIEEGYYENTVAFSNNGSYLSLNSAGNSLHTKASVDANSSWVVSIDGESGNATIQNSAFTNRFLKFNYNNGNPRFACYTSGQIDVKLFQYTEQALEDFTFDDAEMSVYVSQSKAVSVTYTPASASDKELNWSSSNDGVAAVDNDGVVTGVAVGEAIITAQKTIGGVSVERTITVNVLNNVASHHGTQSDPFDVADAVNVARGIFTKDPDGNPISLENEYYVKGLVTAHVTRTTSKVTLWMGDNASQTNKDNGGFEVYQCNKIYSTDIATFYNGKDSAYVANDFPEGSTLLVKSKFTEYNGTPETVNGQSDIIWSDMIEARKFAEGFNSAFEAVCDGDGNSDVDDLTAAWSLQKTAFEALEESSQNYLKAAEAKTTASATPLELFAAKYEYIGGKYQTQLGLEFDFLNRNPQPIAGAPYVIPTINSKNTSTIVIVVVALTSITSIGVLLVIKRKRSLVK